MELNRTKMGVLSDNLLLTYSYIDQVESRHEIDSREIWTLSNLLAGAHHYGIDTMWITPGSDISIIAKRMLEHYASPDEFKIHRSMTHKGQPRFILAYRLNGNTKSVKFGFPEWDDRWPWRSVTDPDTLFHSILYLQDALQFEIAWSPGRTGQELMLDLNHKHPEWLSNIALPDVFRHAEAKDMKWKRPLTGREAAPGMMLHLFDGNSKYLANCTHLNVGQGGPRHVLMPDNGLTVGFDPRLPGLWNVEGWGWKYTPELEYDFACLEDTLTSRPAIREAWIWPEYHRALEPFGRHMWEARCELKDAWSWEGDTANRDARNLAYEAFKSIYTQGFGWMAHPSADSKLYRPDVWALLVSVGYRNLGFKIRQLAREGLRVVYVNVDTLGLVSEGASLQPYEKYILNRQNELGGFRHLGSLPMTIDLAGAFEKRHKGNDPRDIMKEWSDTRLFIEKALKCQKEDL